MVGEDCFATGAFELLDDNVLVREMSSKAIRRENQHGFNFTLCHSVTQSIQSPWALCMFVGG